MPVGFKGTPGSFLTDIQKLAKGIWPWTEGVRARFPDHYKKHVIERHQVQPVPVHYVHDPRKYTVDKYGARIRIQTVPIPTTHVPEQDKGLWGGEEFVVGLRKKNDNPMKPRTPEIWKPRLKKRVFYSEVLDQWMGITVTPRTMDLIDEAKGFDNYILKTHEVDLKSKLGMRLKREMLIKLVTKTLYPDDPTRREAVYDKYKHFIIPAEEAEWIGLTLGEAEKKQKRVEREQELINRRPLKEAYCEELIHKLKNPPKDGEDEVEETSSWFSRLSPFKSSEAKS